MARQSLNETMKLWGAPFSLIIVAALTAMLVTACSKNEGGGTSAAPIPPYIGGYGYGTGYNMGVMPTCQQCPQQMTLLSSMISRNFSMSYGQDLEMGLDYFGDAMAMGQFPQQYPQGYPTGYWGAMPNATYYGKVAAAGYINITVPQNDCGIMPGRYQVTTLVPGLWGNQGVDVIKLQANGPTPFDAMIYTGVYQTAAPQARGIDGRMYPMVLKARFVMQRRDSAAWCERYLE
jgi:hypothetical protein